MTNKNERPNPWKKDSKAMPVARFELEDQYVVKEGERSRPRWTTGSKTYPSLRFELSDSPSLLPFPRADTKPDVNTPEWETSVRLLARQLHRDLEVLFARLSDAMADVGASKPEDIANLFDMPINEFHVRTASCRMLIEEGQLEPLRVVFHVLMERVKQFSTIMRAISANRNPINDELRRSVQELQHDLTGAAKMVVQLADPIFARSVSGSAAEVAIQLFGRTA